MISLVNKMSRIDKSAETKNVNLFPRDWGEAWGVPANGMSIFFEGE